MDDKLRNWLNGSKYLPSFLRDFHDQKALFYSMHQLYDQDPKVGSVTMPDWVTGQCYSIDWFLWFMASRGYTLQKTTTNLNFRPLPENKEHMDPNLG